MSAELEIRLRHWLAALAAAALVHALGIAGFEAATATGWLGADGMARRSGAVRRRLHVTLGIPAAGRLEPAKSPAAAERSSETRERPKPPAHPVADTPGSHVTAAIEAIPRASELDGENGRLDAGTGLRAASSGGSRMGPATGVGSPQASDYFTALYERVSRAHDYPRRARREEIEGRVLLSVRIDRQGRVSSCQVRESSGSPVLDRHAVRTIRRAAPFGAVPEGIADSDLDFDLPLEYELR